MAHGDEPGGQRERFLLPDLGEGLTEATIVSWLVQPGDTVAVDQPVVEVESAKSIAELPSPYAGRVHELHAAVGDVVHKDDPLVTITVGAEAEERDELVPGTALWAEGHAEAGEAAPQRVDEQPEASGAVLVGYGVTESTRRIGRPAGGRFGRGRRHVGIATRQDGSGGSQDERVAAATPLPHDGVRSPVVSPIVRKLARDNGFDAAELEGTGPGSLVMRQDVEAAIAARREAPRLAEDGGSDTRIPIVGVRKIIADRLTNSRRSIPDATIWLDVDATELVRAKERLAEATGERYSVTALVARFVVAGLRRYPVLNSSVDEAAGEIVQHSAVNLGLAAQTGRGLMVPVVRGAERLSLSELRDALATLVAHAQTGDYPPSALSGGTFTLNNYGAPGVDGSSPIINHPEVAMLGLGRLMERPWVVNGQLAVRTVTTLSLVFDHRVCDGDVASGFITYVARCMQEPLLALTEL